MSYDAPRDADLVDIVKLNDTPGKDSNRLVAEPLIEGSRANVRIIRLSPGQSLPPHRLRSDALLRGRRGSSGLESDGGSVAFGAGSLSFYRGDEVLRVSNEGRVGLSLLAFLALLHSRRVSRPERRLRLVGGGA